VLERIVSCTIVIAGANGTRPAHDRMPVVSNKGWEEMCCRSRTSRDRFRRIAEHPPDGVIGGAFKQKNVGRFSDLQPARRILRFVLGPPIIAIAIIIADREGAASARGDSTKMVRA
jgi:hypothetical protein